MEMQRRLNENELENIFGGAGITYDKPKYEIGEIVETIFPEGDPYHEAHIYSMTYSYDGQVLYYLYHRTLIPEENPEIKIIPEFLIVSSLSLPAWIKRKW